MNEQPHPLDRLVKGPDRTGKFYWSLKADAKSVGRSSTKRRTREEVIADLVAVRLELGIDLVPLKKRIAQLEGALDRKQQEREKGAPDTRGLWFLAGVVVTAAVVVATVLIGGY